MRWWGGVGVQNRVRKSRRTRRRPARFCARGMLTENSTACAKSPMTPVSSRSASHGDFAHPTTRAVYFRLRHMAVGPNTAFSWVCGHEWTSNCPTARPVQIDAHRFSASRMALTNSAAFLFCLESLCDEPQASRDQPWLRDVPLSEWA